MNTTNDRKGFTVHAYEINDWTVPAAPTDRRATFRTFAEAFAAAEEWMGDRAMLGKRIAIRRNAGRGELVALFRADGCNWQVVCGRGLS